MDYQNIMKELLNPSHTPNRSGKDLTHRKVFTAKAGELLPILCEEMVPNDYFEIDTASLVRTFPLQTAAFVRARVHFDFFFVPKTAIWRNWDRFFYQRDNFETSLIKGFAYEPNIKIADLYNACNDRPGSILDSASARAKVLQLLGYGNLGATNVYASATPGSPQETVGNKSLTLLPIAGYNRIYSMYYRNAWRDEPSPQDATTYSLDDMNCASYASSLYSISPGVPPMVKMHYHPWFSDLFMGSLPNQQFGSVSTVGDLKSYVSLTNANFSSSFASVSGRKYSSSNYLQVSDGAENSTLFVNPSFDVIALRKALALQKWKESNMRAGWKNRNQARAMFGVSTPEDRKHEIEFLKGYDFPVMIDEVINQSNTNLGELAGKGIGVGNGDLLKFNSGERHGYLYCIAYVLPMAEYDAIGIEKSLVRSEPFDHFVPAFENLGLEPIYKYELNAEGDPNYFDSVVGYAPRYHEYKTRIDKVYGEFMSGKTLCSWVSVRRDLQNIANLGYIPTQYYYVNPSVLDQVFAFNVDGSQTTDQFILNVSIRDKAVRPMSDLGLPNL